MFGLDNGHTNLRRILHRVIPESYRRGSMSNNRSCAVAMLRAAIAERPAWVEERATVGTDPSTDPSTDPGAKTERRATAFAVARLTRLTYVL